MNYKDAFHLSLKNNKNNPFKRNIFILVIIIIFLIIFIPFTFYKTYEEAIDLLYNTMYDFKIIRINGSYDEEVYNQLMSYQEKNEHIVKIYKDQNTEQNLHALISDILFENEADVRVYPNLRTFTPDEKILDLGRTLKNQDEIICSSTMFFGLYADKSFSDGLNFKEKLDEKINLKYRKIVYDEKTNEATYEYIGREYKLVGTYDSTIIDRFDSCYIMESEYEELRELTKTVGNKNETIGENEIIIGPNAMAIYVDSYKNVDEVLSYLDSIKVDYSVDEIDDEFLSVTLAISFIITVVLIIVGAVIVIVYIREYLKDNVRRLTLYKVLGYSKNDIFRILTLELVELLIISFIITLLIGIMAKFVIEYNMHSLVSFSMLDIKLNILSLFVYFSIITLIAYFIIKSELYRIDSLNIRELVEK